MYCSYQSHRLLVLVGGHSVHEIGPSVVCVQSNVLINHTEGHTKPILLVGGTYVLSISTG